MLILLVQGTHFEWQGAMNDLGNYVLSVLPPPDYLLMTNFPYLGKWGLDKYIWIRGQSSTPDEAIHHSEMFYALQK